MVALVGIKKGPPGELQYRGYTQTISLILFFLLTLSFGLTLALKLPDAPGILVFKKSGAMMDASNSSEGYIMVRRESHKRQKLRVTKDKESYDYDLNGHGDLEVFPLQMGDGKYNVAVFENSSGSNFKSKFSKDISVELASDEIPFCYPNQLIDFGESTRCVALAQAICEGLATEMEKVIAVNAYVTANIAYDYNRASQITGGEITSYIPDIDDVLDKKLGICFDYSAVVACMLRSQGIPTQLVMGYVGSQYHAWNRVFVDGKWGRLDATFAVTQTKAIYSDPARIY